MKGGAEQGKWHNSVVCGGPSRALKWQEVKGESVTVDFRLHQESPAKEMPPRKTVLITRLSRSAKFGRPPSWISVAMETPFDIAPRERPILY